MPAETNITTDSDVTLSSALAQNPRSPAPRDILDAMRLSSVTYLGFNGRLHKGQIVMHAEVIDEVGSFFALALTLGFPIQSVIPISDPRFSWDDIVSCDANNSSGFNYRSVTTNPDKLSKHAYGLALDINPVQNIYVKYDERLKVVFTAPKGGIYDESRPGTLSRTHPLVTHMKDLGWKWGGDWTPETGRTDYQHFEKDVPLTPRI